MDELFTRLPFFRDVPRDAVATLAGAAQRHELAPETQTIAEGSQAASMFFLSTGTARVVHGPQSERIGTLTAPTLFGEMALLASTHRLASVVTESPCIAFELGRDIVFQVAFAHPVLRDAIMGFHHDRLMKNILASNDLFEPINDDRKLALAAHFEPHTIAAGTVLLQQGGPGAGLFVILRGGCQVLRDDGSGPIQLAQLAEGDIFGEISLVLFDQPCTATVQTSSECVVLHLPREAFQKLVMTAPEMRDRVIKLALGRKRATEEAAGSARKANLL